MLQEMAPERADSIANILLQDHLENDVGRDQPAGLINLHSQPHCLHVQTLRADTRALASSC